MHHAQEKLGFSKHNWYPSPQRARTSRRSDAGSVLWATVDEMMKEYDSELDDDYTTCEKMVHSLGEPNADRHSSPLQYWKKNEI